MHQKQSDMTVSTTFSYWYNYF